MCQSTDEDLNIRIPKSVKEKKSIKGNNNLSVKEKNRLST